VTRPDLAFARAAEPLTDKDCRIHFGVGLATIERVEAGQIVPGEELAERIDRFVRARGGRSPSAALPGCPTARAGGLTGGGGCDTPAANFGDRA
jgi:hypothetical protein